MFTSKLPRFTSSAKRPSGPNEGSSTSFGHGLSSNIPVSVRKANLFTPQAPRTTHGTSTTAKKSNFATTEKKSYQRASKPVPDRDEQMRMFTALVDYLKLYGPPGFPIPDAKKFFVSVSTTETSRLFEVLITKLFPDFKLNKLEVDVPEVLSLLGYPYIRSVTKSSLVSITTRQAVGNLLVIFDWLVKIIRLDEGDDDEALFGLQVNDNKDVSAESEFELEELKNECSRVREEVEMLSKEYQMILSLEHTKKNLEDNIRESQDYQKQMQEIYLPRKREELRRCEEELIKKQLKREQTEKKLEILSNDPMVKTGQPSQEEILRVEEQLAFIRQEIKNVQIEHDRRILEMNKKSSKIDRDISRYNEMADIEEARLLSHIAEEREKLNEERKEYEVHQDLLLGSLKTTIESNEQKAAGLFQEAKTNGEYWRKVEQIVEENNRVARKGMKLLCSKQPVTK